MQRQRRCSQYNQWYCWCLNCYSLSWW